MNRKTLIRIAVLVSLVMVAAIGYFRFGDSLTLTALAEKESQLREFGVNNPWLVYVVAFLVYVLVTGLSIPGAAALTLASGWYFGLWKGVLLVSFASTTGATIAFLLSRYLFRDAVQERFGERLGAFNDNLEQDGAFYLFTLRLIPAVPFFVINVVMGLTKMKTMTFWWVSQLGMLAGTVAYVYAGHSVPALKDLAEKGVSGILSLQMLIAFAILGIFPLAAKKLMGMIRSGKSEHSV